MRAVHLCLVVPLLLYPAPCLADGGPADPSTRPTLTGKLTFELDEPGGSGQPSFRLRLPDPDSLVTASDSLLLSTPTTDRAATPVVLPDLSLSADPMAEIPVTLDRPALRSSAPAVGDAPGEGPWGLAALLLVPIAAVPLGWRLIRRRRRPAIPPQPVGFVAIPPPGSPNQR